MSRKSTRKGDKQLQDMEVTKDYEGALSEALTLVETEYALVPSSTPTDAQVVDAVIKAARDFEPASVTLRYKGHLKWSALEAWGGGYLKVTEFQWS